MKRFYFALTNDCNRSCKYCSCFSRPGKQTYLSFDKIKEYINSVDEFEMQLEGGEPLLHPNFYDIIEYAANTDRCKKVILTSNFALINEDNIYAFIERLNSSGLEFLLKPSINYELYKEDETHFEKMKLLKQILNGFHYDRMTLKFNVRLDKTQKDDFILEELAEYDLYDDSSIFYYQKYGYASNNESFDPPFVITNPVDFSLISPDGLDFGMDLIARSEHMKGLI